MGYFDFQKKSDCIVCIDSDGCAMDTMEVKHRTCFGPQWIKTFGLTEHEAECMELWLSINLYSITRGINRFKGLALALAEVEKRGLGNIEGLAEYEAWTKEAKELSNPALLAVTQKSDNPCFEKALLWSIRTNRAIHALPAEDRPFPNVKSAMDAMAKQADLAAVLPKDFPLPARYAHPVVLTRMIRVLREGRAQTADQALEVVKQDLKALTADVQVEQWEYDEVVAIKPMFLLSDYQ